MLLNYSLNINSFQYMHISFLLLCLQRRIVHTVGVVFSNPQLKHLKHLHKLQISTVVFFIFVYLSIAKHMQILNIVFITVHLVSGAI